MTSPGRHPAEYNPVSTASLPRTARSRFSGAAAARWNRHRRSLTRIGLPLVTAQAVSPRACRRPATSSIASSSKSHLIEDGAAVPLPPRLTGFGQVNFRVMAKARFLFAQLDASADITINPNSDSTVGPIFGFRDQTTKLLETTEASPCLSRARVFSSVSYGADDIAAR